MEETMLSNAVPNGNHNPLYPDELQRLDRIYEIVRRKAGLSWHDPLTARVATMTIRFYQLGIQDDQALIDTVSRAYDTISDRAQTAA
jgi:hypothetical protein